MLATAPPVKVASVIRGSRVRGGGETLSVADPATGDERAVVEAATPDDVARAVEAAREAQRAWAAAPAGARAAVLAQAADRVARGREELAHAITLEMGKVLSESRAEVDEAVFYLRFMAGEGARLVGETRPSADPGRLVVAERIPAGVVGVVTPWNFPLCIPVWKIAAALVTGNAVVFKPALQTTATGAMLADALFDAGLPDGVLNLVVGRGEVTGEALARHPGVRVVSFTGSTDVGHRLAATAGRRGARAALELGGKNVAVVLADADLDQAADEIALGAFATTGQRCTATSRVVAAETIHDELVSLLAARAETLSVGPGTEPTSDIGPLVSSTSRDRVASAVARAVEDGGRLVAGGEVPPELPERAGYYRPAVVTGLSESHPLVRDELFGPVTAVLPARDDEDALRLANASTYGLAASVFTRDIGRALAFGRGLEAGMVFVNGTTVGAETHMPFGGLKASGNGSRDTGLAALETYTEWKTLYLTAPPKPR